MHIMLWQDWASSNEDLSLLEWKRHSELPPGARPPLHPGCFSGCLFWGIHRQTITWEGCCSSHDLRIYINLCWTVAQQCLFQCPWEKGRRPLVAQIRPAPEESYQLPQRRVRHDLVSQQVSKNVMQCKPHAYSLASRSLGNETLRAKALQSHHSFEVSTHSQPAPWLGKQDSWQTLWLGFSRLAINLCQTSGVDSSLTLLCIIRP